MNLEEIQEHLTTNRWMQHSGVYAIVDGQYGSTGKGLAAALMAQLFADQVTVATCNAGPNSGHTSYFGDRKVVLRQLPTFGVTAALMGQPCSIYLNAGAIIDPNVLEKELDEFEIRNLVRVHPNAARVNTEALEAEAGIKHRIGSTGKGTGAALAAKIMRDPDAVVGSHNDGYAVHGPADLNKVARSCTVSMEVSQGFSLGVDQSFYPYVTSRNCTVGAALSDAGIHPSFLRQTMMVVRTFPIRVGGNSGPCYPDQTEATWDQIGQEPEMTTVTQKVRRVFTWSHQQFADACRANRPEFIFLNFMNYLQPEVHYPFVSRMVATYRQALDREPLGILLGYGPRNEDIRLWRP